MNFPFLNRPTLHKITTSATNEAGATASHVLAGLLAELPDLLMAYVADIASGQILAAYTTNPAYNPNQLSLRNARLLNGLETAYAANSWLGGPLQDLAVLLDDQLHLLRRLHDRPWYCFLAVYSADANLGIVREALRRHASPKPSFAANRMASP